MNELHNCHHLVSTISDYVDGELSPEICSELEKHLNDCVNCQIVVNTLRKTIELYHKVDEGESLPNDIRQRLFYRLDLEEFLKTEK